MAIDIRDAEEGDLPAVLAIHNHVIATSTANFSYHEVDIEDRRAFLRDRQGRGFPFLVAIDDDALLGYASFGPFRPHDGYRLTVEHSVYVAPAHRRRGVAGALMTALIGRAEAMGLHVMVGGLDAANAASVALHERFGFGKVGLMPQVGLKFDRYLDLLWMQKILDGQTGSQVAASGATTGRQGSPRR